MEFFVKPIQCIVRGAVAVGLIALVGCGSSDGEEGVTKLSLEPPSNLVNIEKVQDLFPSQTPFDSRKCAVSTGVRTTGAIVNPYFLTHSQTWRDYKLNKTRLKNALKCLEVKRVYLQMRRADDFTKEPFFERGALYFDSAKDYSVPMMAESWNHNKVLVRRETMSRKYYTENMNDPRIYFIATETFIKELNDEGFEVWAWLPIFNDPVLWKQRPDLRLEPPSADMNQLMVSPANLTVQEIEYKRITEIVTRFKPFGLKGIALDWFRYTDDAQPQDAAAKAEFFQLLVKKQYPIPGSFNIDQIRSNAEGLALFNEYRTKVLHTYLAKIHRDLKLLTGGTIRLGAFLLPHSAKRPGSGNTTLAGIDLRAIAAMNLDIDIMPMIYPIDKWDAGYNTWMDFALDVSKRMQTWTFNTNSSYYPVLSITKTSQADLFSLNRYHANQKMPAGMKAAAGVVYYFPGNWLAPNASESPGDAGSLRYLADSALQRLCRSRGYTSQSCNGNWPLVQPPL